MSKKELSYFLLFLKLKLHPDLRSLGTHRIYAFIRILLAKFCLNFIYEYKFITMAFFRLKQKKIGMRFLSLLLLYVGVFICFFTNNVIPCLSSSSSDYSANKPKYVDNSGKVCNSSSCVEHG
jgi:hypothetical protein